MILRHAVTPEESGAELKNIVRRGMGISASLLIRLKYSGGLAVNGRPEFSNYRAEAGDVIELDVTAAEPDTEVEPERGELETLMEDQWLIAVNKPSGVIVHPSRAKNSGTLQNFILGHLADTGQRLICHAVNRLDRDTSGVVLFAKSACAKSMLAAALSMPEAEKEYTALVAGSFSPENGVIDAPVGRVQEGNMLRAVLPEGQRAVTHYKTVRRSGEYSIVKFLLQTGRTHQIRVHCLYSGCPILGDGLYFTDKSRAISEKLGVKGQALHAGRLRFRHPGTGDLTELTAPVRRPDIAEFMCVW